MYLNSHIHIDGRDKDREGGDKKWLSMKKKKKRKMKKKSAEQFRPFNKDKCLTFISQPCAQRKLSCLSAAEQNVENVLDDKEENKNDKHVTHV